MSLEVSPLELDFRRPFTQEVSQTISLGNRNDSPVAFKVKTTAPKRYCVRPNSGRIEPGTAVEVQVLLQAMKEDPPLDQKCRDKFLVQSVLVPADKEFSNVTAIWQDADANRDTMKPFERKIKVVFLPPVDADGQTPPQHSGLINQKHNDDPPAYTTSPTSVTAYSTPAAARTAPAPGASSTQPAQPAADESSGARPEVAQRSSSDSRSPRPSADGTARPEVTVLKSQLQEAQSQIERLKDQLADKGLRQRKVPTEGAAESSDKSELKAKRNSLGDGATSLLQASGEQGVSLNLVAILCFISFLLGYLFF
ncbi:hypothetical protein KEM56_007322 [Ascosphaera pollenicola]|nr:hypothetical protein KEM56_007322 [Ascosphaera pollenicola]